MNMDNTWGPLLAGIFISFSINISFKLGSIILILEAIRELQIIAVAS